MAALSLFLAAPAWALFSVLSSDATGTSAAAVLGTPVVTTGGVTATSVTFTIAAPTSGPTPTAYRVARTAPTTAASVCTVTGSSGSCTDTAPVAGTTNTYAVYAGLAGSSWESPTPRTVTVAVPSLDPNAPVTTGTASPAPNAAGWNTSAVTVTLSATDVSGVANTYYTTNGSTPTTASTRYTGPFTVSSTATVRFFSVDKRGNTETPTSLAVKIDTVAPTGALTAPASAAVVSGTVTVSGTSADTGGSGLAAVQPQVQQGSGAWTNLGSAITTGASTWSTSWATAGLTDGAYSLRALVTDVAGSTTTTATRSVTVSNNLVVTAPATAVAGTSFNVTIRTAATVSGTKAITVTGLQSSPNGTAPVLKTSASFTSGVATISLRAYRAGSQTITVTTTADGRQGTSGAVVVAPRAQGQLYFTSCSGTTRELRRELGHRDHLRSPQHHCHVRHRPPRHRRLRQQPGRRAGHGHPQAVQRERLAHDPHARRRRHVVGDGDLHPTCGNHPQDDRGIRNDDGSRRGQGHADGAALLTRRRASTQERGPDVTTDELDEALEVGLVLGGLDHHAGGADLDEPAHGIRHGPSRRRPRHGRAPRRSGPTGAARRRAAARRPGRSPPSGG